MTPRSLTAREQNELILAVAQRRDKEAFTALFDHFAPRLNAYLQRLGSDAASAEELIQDVMRVLWLKADLFDAAKSSASTWLYRIARNRRIDTLRRERLEFFDPQDYNLDQPSEERAADITMDGWQREQKVREALELLPQDQLDLVRLAFFEELSHAQIAEKTGLPLGTVKSRIRLAFTRLRRLLEAAGLSAGLDQ